MYPIAFQLQTGLRENLEDSAGAFELIVPGPADVHITLLVVCDGVGGRCHGEVASNLAKQYVLTAFAAAVINSPPDPLSTEVVLAQALAGAHTAIVNQSRRDPQLEGMATTVVAAAVLADRLYVAWAGDSRCYLVRHETATLLTRDHSEVQRLVDAGLVSEEDAKHHPLAHVINRFAGQGGDLEPQTAQCQLAPEDLVLLCTDGLTDVLSDAQIAETVNASLEDGSPFDAVPDRLVRLALRAGTTDNVTCLAYRHQPQTTTAQTTLTGAYAQAAAHAIQSQCKELTHGTSQTASFA